MKKISTTTAALLFAATIFAQTKVYEGTPVSVKIVKEISGKTSKPGDVIEFTLAKNVIVNDTIVLKEGWRVVGTVTEAAGSKALGKKGKLEFSIDYLYTSKQQPIKLRSTVEANVKGRGATTAAVSILVSPLGLLWHGKQAKYEAGTVFNAYIDHDVIIN